MIARSAKAVATPPPSSPSVSMRANPLLKVPLTTILAELNRRATARRTTSSLT